MCGIRRYLLTGLKQWQYSVSIDGVPWQVHCQKPSADVLPFIRVLCNSSLQNTAVVTPVLKKAGADTDEPRNYRPIWNLTFLSKVIERIMAGQITEHLDHANLMPALQFAYHRQQSTESDTLDAAVSRRVTLLGLLDLSVAFNTVDHDILLRRLVASFRISGLTLKWISSFLTGRTQLWHSAA